MNRCPKLAGRCTGTGDHWPHESEPATVPAPAGFPDEFLIRFFLADYGQGPQVIVETGRGDAQLGVDQLLDVGDRFAGLATEVRKLACRLSVAEGRERGSAGGGAGRQ